MCYYPTVSSARHRSSCAAFNCRFFSPGYILTKSCEIIKSADTPTKAVSSWSTITAVALTCIVLRWSVGCTDNRKLFSEMPPIHYSESCLSSAYAKEVFSLPRLLPGSYTCALPLISPACPTHFELKWHRARYDKNMNDLPCLMYKCVLLTHKKGFNKHAHMNKGIPGGLRLYTSLTEIIYSSSRWNYWLILNNEYISCVCMAQHWFIITIFNSLQIHRL